MVQNCSLAGTPCSFYSCICLYKNSFLCLKSFGAYLRSCFVLSVYRTETRRIPIAAALRGLWRPITRASSPCVSTGPLTSPLSLTTSPGRSALIIARGVKHPGTHKQITQSAIPPRNIGWDGPAGLRAVVCAWAWDAYRNLSYLKGIDAGWTRGKRARWILQRGSNLPCGWRAAVRRSQLLPSHHFTGSVHFCVIEQWSPTFWGPV